MLGHVIDVSGQNVITINPSNPPPPMNPLPIAKRFERWYIDILGPLFKTKEGCEYILLCVDAGTRWVEAFPLKSQTAVETARVLYKEIFTRYGAPKVLFSDRGRNFMSKLVNALCELFDIKQHHTSAYHPNTNGLVERQNSTVASSLRTYCSGAQEKWTEVLPGVLRGHRKSPSSHSNDYSPYYLLFGEEMRMPFDVSLEPKDNLNRDAKDHINELIDQLKVTNEIVKNNIQWHQQQNKERHELRVKLPDFKLGDKVLIKVNKVPKGQSSKLYDKAEGPYQIIELGPNFTYKLKRCSDNKVNASYMNATKLKMYHDPDIHRAHFHADTQNEQDMATPTQQAADDNHNAQQQNLDQQPDTQKQDPQIHAPNTDVHTPPAHNDPVPPLDIPHHQDHTTNTPTTPAPPTPTLHDPNKKWKLNRLLAGRYKHGRREIRVEWENSSRTWEPDSSFDREMLEEIDKKFTKHGKRRRTCFKHKY